jgi:hypothetical protein
LAPSFYSYQLKNHSATGFSARQLRKPSIPETIFGKSTMNTALSTTCSGLVAVSAVLWLRQRRARREAYIRDFILPLGLFALDGKLDIPNGFTYVPDCSGFQRKGDNGDGSVPYCAADLSSSGGGCGGD